ncbi:MAG: hypothetical protein HY984_00630, partial [Candidatus Magasanikbacteria bacterium]|nr:hypothetical protein [Candidatus Magasanikbacteria bacterium]
MGLVVGGGVFAQSSASDTFGLNPVGQGAGLGGEDLRVTIAKIIRAALAFLGVVAVGIILYGGFVYMTSGGNEDKVGEARKIIVNGTIGLVIILSAFSIAQFILRQLSEATGSGIVPIPSRCEELRTANDPAYWRECRRSNFDCSTNPEWCCALDNFVVKSITPRTDNTTVNNITIRTILSRGTRNLANEIFTIVRGTTTITDQFAYRFVNDENSVVEASYTGASSCSGAVCLPGNGSTYIVTINPDIRDMRGTSLATETSCGLFGRQATFRIPGAAVIDTQSPSVLGGRIYINSSTASDVFLPRGSSYPIDIPVIDNAGAGYVRLNIDNAAGDSLAYYDGPTLTRGSNATNARPYLFTYPLFLARNTPAPQR